MRRKRSGSGDGRIKQLLFAIARRLPAMLQANLAQLPKPRWHCDCLQWLTVGFPAKGSPPRVLCLPTCNLLKAPVAFSSQSPYGFGKIFNLYAPISEAIWPGSRCYSAAC